MRVLFVWHAAVEPEYRKLFRGLAERGWDLRALLPHEWTEGGRPQRPVSGPESGYRLVVLRVAPTDRNRRFIYLNGPRLVGLFRGFRPDIVHLFEEPGSFVAAQIVAVTRLIRPKPRVLVHSFDNLASGPNGLLGRVERFVLRRADALLTVPREGETVWRGRGFTGPIFQAPVGVDETLFKKDPAPLELFSGEERRSHTVVGYVGRLIPEKGVRTLIEATQLLAEKGTRIKLVLVGQGPQESELRSEIASRGLGGRVLFERPMSGDRLPRFYSSLDILVLPSLTTARWKEQFGRVLVEAMACETAVVGSSSGEIPEIVGEAGLIFPEGDAPALARSIRELAQKADLRVKLGRAGREGVLERFTWARMARNLDSIYRTLRPSPS